MERIARKRHSRAGLAIDYVLLWVIVIAALISMSVIIKRALCGKWRQSADSFGYGRQYEP
jgi:Flp pilus assembly pilin Flp